MNQSVKWNLSEDNIFEIIHSTLIDILSEQEIPCNLDKLVLLLNSKCKVYKLNDNKKLNSFSKYLKIEHKGILNFIEEYNLYGIIKNGTQIYVKLYRELINTDIKYEKRLTRDTEWVMIDSDSGSE